MNTKTWKLIGSAPTLVTLESLISRFYGGTPITFGSVEPGIGLVSNSKGTIEGVRIRKVKGRYRFEGLL